MALSSNATFACGGSSGDDGGPRMHLCRCMQEALRAAGIEYDKVIAGHGSPFPFLRKGSREELRDVTGATKAAGAQAAQRDGHHPLPRHPLLDWPAAMITAARAGAARQA